MTFSASGRFAGRVAIVTGAARGIGLAIARRLAGEGASLVLADLDGAALADAAASLADGSASSGPAGSGGPSGSAGRVGAVPVLGGGRPVVVAGDLAVPGTAGAVVGAAVDAHGRVDVLVNNAGGGVIRPTLEHTEETLRATIDRNLWTTIYCTLAALPVMRDQGYGRVVNIGAESVRNGLHDHAIYNAAKGGVHGLTTGLAREFVADGITVNTVAPCMVATEQLQPFLDDPALVPLLATITSTIPAGRPATMEEVAAVVAFVASEEASFVTGQVISVNGASSML